MLLNCGVGEDFSESLGLQGDQISQSSRKWVLNIHWKDWCLSWNSNILATWCEEPTHWKRPWWWERLKAGGEGDDRGQDGWMTSPTWWTWVWTSSRSWWWTGKPGVLWFMGSQRIRHNWAAELSWTELLLLLLNHFGRVRLCVTPEMAAYQALLSLGFSRQEHWSGLPFPNYHQEQWHQGKTGVQWPLFSAASCSQSLSDSLHPFFSSTLLSSRMENVDHLSSIA